MKREKRGEENRYPRHIEKRRWPEAGEKYAYLVEIAQRLLSDHCLGAAQWQRRNRQIDAPLQANIEKRAPRFVDAS